VLNVKLAQKLFWLHPMELLGDVGQEEARFFVHFKIALTLAQDTCMVCTERTIGREIILDTPDGTPT
jgi:putative NIF3 family GTP cyclohydrolase 1 type 2